MIKVVWQRMLALKVALKRRCGRLWYYSLLQFVCSKLQDVVNLVVGAFLVPAFISSDDLGAIVPFRMILAFAAILMSVFTRVALKYLNIFHVEGNSGRIKALLLDLGKVAVLFSILSVVAIILGRDFVAARLRLPDYRLLWVLSFALVMAFWTPLLTVAAQGLMRFRHIIFSNVVRGIVYLALAVILLRQFQLLGFLLAVSGASFVVLVYLLWVLRDCLGQSVVSVRYDEHWSGIRCYALNVGTVAVLMGIAAIVEPWTIRNFTPRVDSAGYYMAFMFGQVPLFLSAAFTPFLFPLISERFERGERTQHMLMQSVVAVLCLGVPFVIFTYFFGEWLLGLNEAWRVYIAYAPFVWRVGGVSVLQGLIIAFMAHENACSRFGYVKFFSVVFIAEVILLYCLMGWIVFKSIVPIDVWQMVQNIVSHKLSFAVWMMLATRCLLVAVASIIWLRQGRTVIS